MEKCLESFLKLIDVSEIPPILLKLFEKVYENDGRIECISDDEILKLKESFSKELMYLVGFCLYIKKLNKINI